MGGELEGVGEEVEHDLLQPLLVGADRLRQLAVELDVEARPLSAASWRNVRSMCCLRLASASRRARSRRSRFDLRQVEDVVDEVEEVRSGRVDRPRELDLLVVEIALRVVGEQLRQDQQRVERRAQLVAHVGEELGLVLRGQRELLGFLLERAARHLDFDILRFDLLLLVLEQLRLFLQFLVRAVQLFLLSGQLGLARLQLLRQELRLLRAGPRCAWSRRSCSRRCRPIPSAGRGSSGGSR